MEQGLQNLLMFRDNLQQPDMTGMQKLGLLENLTVGSMGSQDYINQPMMMSTGGLIGLPVAQAGFGGFIRNIVRAPARIVKSAAKAVKRVAKSPVGSIALGLAAPTLLGPSFLINLNSLSSLATFLHHSNVPSDEASSATHICTS